MNAIARELMVVAKAISASEEDYVHDAWASANAVKTRMNGLRETVYRMFLGQWVDKPRERVEVHPLSKARYLRQLKRIDDMVRKLDEVLKDMPELVAIAKSVDSNLQK